MDNPKVSVIIPVYNVEKFLQRCIDALLVQTYPNLEFIFVDDGSSDGSYSILNAAANLDGRIHVYKQANAGPSAARNTGIAHSTGKYIMFCDSDDTVEPNWCKAMVRAIQENPQGWIVSEINVLSEAGDLLQKYSHLAGPETTTKSEYYILFAEGLSGSAYNKIYAADVLRTNNIVFDECLRRGEDVKFNLDYLAQCNNIQILSQAYYNYYRYEQVQTLTNTYHEDDFQTQAMLYRIRKPYIAEKYLCKFQTHYWHVLSMELDQAMDTPYITQYHKRLHANSMNLKSPQYKELLLAVGNTELPSWQARILYSENYTLFWLTNKLSRFKKKVLSFIDRGNYE